MHVYMYGCIQMIIILFVFAFLDLFTYVYLMMTILSIYPFHSQIRIQESHTITLKVIIIDTQKVKKMMIPFHIGPICSFSHKIQNLIPLQ